MSYADKQVDAIQSTVNKILLFRYEIKLHVTNFTIIINRYIYFS